MFTFVILYTVIYIVLLAFILSIIKINNFNMHTSQLSFNVFWQSINLYMSNAWVFKWLFFQLSGFPPVFIFFLKFNFLFSLLKYSSFFIQVLVFINLLLGMFFYIQIFSITSKVYSGFFLKTFVKNNKILQKNSYLITEKYYLLCTMLAYFLFISFCSFLFFFDIFIIFKAFVI